MWLDLESLGVVVVCSSDMAIFGFALKKNNYIFGSTEGSGVILFKKVEKPMYPENSFDFC